MRKLVIANSKVSRGIGRKQSFWLVNPVLFGLLLASCQRTEVPVLDTHLLATRGSAKLLFRRETDESERLLIRNAKSETIYAYDPVSGNVSTVPIEVWQIASGEIGAKCGIDGGLRSGPKLRRTSRRLLANDQRVKTAGKLTILFNSSPKQNFVAVLSAEDRFRLPPLFPSLGGGGGGPSGQHYHQLFSVPELEPIGKPTPLAIRAKTPLKICWTPNERYVIYCYVEGSRMCIVPVDEGR